MGPGVGSVDELGLVVLVSDGFVRLAFDLLSSGLDLVVTGYLNGVMTVDLAEFGAGVASQDLEQPSRRLVTETWLPPAEPGSTRSPARARPTLQAVRARSGGTGPGYLHG